MKKKYCCNYCSEEFSDRNNRNRHARIRCKLNPNSLKMVAIKNNSNAKILDDQNKDQDTNLLNDSGTTPTTAVSLNQQDVLHIITQKIAEQVGKTLEDQIDKKMEDKIANKLKEHDEKIELLEKEQQLIKVTPNTVNNTNTINNTINVIYVTDKLDYLAILNEKFGEEKTIQYLKNKLHSKIKGEVEVFCDIHLNGPVNSWPVKCPDKTKKHLYLTQPDNTMILDMGGVKLHKNFYGNYQNALLRLINQQIFQVVDQGVGTEKFEGLRDDLLDDFDLQAFQTRAIEVGRENPNNFVKKLMEEMSQKELLNIC